MHTFLSNQGLPPRWEADHDHADLGVLDLDAEAVRLAGARHLHRPPDSLVKEWTRGEANWTGPKGNKLHQKEKEDSW